MNKIKVIALMGKAGAGKDYLLHELVKSNDYNEIISCTTRPPREGEVDGKNYHFIKKEEFEEAIRDNFMLEYAEFRGWYYGTPVNSLNGNKTNIGVFNIDGIKQLLKNKQLSVTVYYIQASDKTRLRRQLDREENPDVDEIIRRWETDKVDFERIDFPYMIYWND